MSTGAEGVSRDASATVLEAAEQEDRTIEATTNVVISSKKGTLLRPLTRVTISTLHTSESSANGGNG